jgi:hypothetical protein
MNRLILVFGMLFWASTQFAQVGLGSISGVVLEDKTGESIPSARLWVEENGNQIFSGTDFDGRFSFKGLSPGTYILFARSMGKDTIQVTNIEVKADQNTRLADIRLKESTGIIGTTVVIRHDPLIITADIERIDIKPEDIEHSPIKFNPLKLFSSFNSDVTIPEGSSDVIIRGSRPGDAIFYIDGVKTSNMKGVPGVAIKSMTGYTGGVPAKYGDTTGGVISLETKGYFDLYYAWKGQ